MGGSAKGALRQSRGIPKEAMTLATQETRRPPPPPCAVRIARRSIRVEPLTCAIGAACQREPRRRLARPGLVAEIRALLLKHKVLFFRDQDITRAEHVAFARHFGDLEDHPVAGSDPETPGWCASTSRPSSPTTATRTPGTPTPPGARSRPSAACCAAWNAAGRQRHDVGQHGAGLRAAAATVKDQIAGLRARRSIEASFGAAMPIEKRLALHAQFPDAEHPVVRTHAETGEKILFVNAFDPLHQLPHPGQRALRPGLHARGGSDLLRYLIEQGADPEYQVRFRWKPNSWPCGTTGRRSTTPSWTTRPAIARWNAPGSWATRPSEAINLATTQKDKT